MNAQFAGCTRAVAALHEAVSLIGDLAVELVLTRRSADACKVTHLLRAGGDAVEDQHLRDYDSGPCSFPDEHRDEFSS